MAIPGNKILDLLISMALIYALLSLLVSILLEWWNHFRKTRALQLKANIFKLLNDSINLQFGELFYNHYLISGIHNKRTNSPPQYISSKLFAEVLIDVISHRNKHNHPVQLIGLSLNQGKQYKIEEKSVPPSAIELFKNGLDQLKPSPFTDTLHSFVLKSEGDFEKLKASLASWFDDYMDRASGWYKSLQQKKLYFFGFLVAIALNVDSLHLVKMIGLDDTLRNNLVQAAGQITDDYNMLSDSAKLRTDSLEGIVKDIFPKISLRDNDKKLTVDSLMNLLGKRTDSTSRAQYKKLDTLFKADSTTREYQQRAERILSIATSLNIPIGWDKSAAPLSWKRKSTSLAQHPKKIRVEKQNQLIDYLDQRNQWGFWNGAKYLIGILISGFSLSFGAPFWFDTLMKLVNIRRAGKKPEATNVK